MGTVAMVSMATKQHSKENKTAVQTGQAVSVNMLKGGVGKSAISLNVADRLSVRGHDVLYMDLDPNGHVTYGLGFEDVFDDPTHDIGNTVIYDHTPPTEWVYDTAWDWDFVPAGTKLEELERTLSTEADVSLLRDNFTEPLFNSGEYDYIIMDGGGEWSMLAKNAYGAAGQTMIPVTPGEETRSGFKRTFERAIQPIQKRIDFEILAIVPNMIQNRIDYQYPERELLEDLNRSEKFAQYLPKFARIPPEDWDKMDNGELDTIPKPGIRNRDVFGDAFKAGKPVGRHSPNADVLEHLDELAEIVEQGGISHDG